MGKYLFDDYYYLKMDDGLEITVSRHVVGVKGSVENKAFIRRQKIGNVFPTKHRAIRAKQILKAKLKRLGDESLI